MAVILETVAESPDGAPSGPMYAAMMDKIDINVYQTLLSMLLGGGLVTKRGNVVFARCPWILATISRPLDVIKPLGTNRTTAHAG